ncbi:MAG: hypothetical protein JWO95_3317 [Verrucomicrobiales bacterium]|nr:hypothetical protein [Verrucomicrobiales bacterium]
MRGSSSVDDYVAQLRVKGERLYFTDPPLPQMTNGTPGIDKLVSAANSVGGLSPIKVMDVSTSGVAVVAWKQLPLIDGMARTNTMAWSQLLAILGNNAKPLREIRESVSEPEPDTGWQTNIFTVRRTFIQQRTAVQLVSAATVAALHETNYDDAFENLQALTHLSQLERNDMTLVAQMIRIAVTGVGLATTWEALQSDGLTDAQWSQIQTSWGKVNVLQAIERGFVGERMYCFNHFEMVRTGQTNSFNWSGSRPDMRDRVATTIWRATVANQDEMFYLKTIGRYIDNCRLVTNGIGAVEVSKASQREYLQLDKVLSKSFTSFKYPMSLRAIPNFNRAVTTAFHCETQRRLAIMAIAIKRYQLRHGKAPETLTALVPEFCSEVLLDPMDWKPLRYRVNADGSFTLYSIGDDGKDDGGDTTAKADWLQARDIVWPKAIQKNALN